MIRIALAGDLFIARPLPMMGYEGLKEISGLINEHEVKFANLETTVHRREGFPAAYPGGTWAMADPVCLKDVKRYGFNIVSTANNHLMDYSHNGLLATHRYLSENELLHAGTGENLADAAAAAFVECSEGRVAVIGTTSSFHDSDAAGNQRMDMKGRPGVNPLRHRSVYEVSAENYAFMQRLASELGVNNYHNQAIKEGYIPARENFHFANYEFIKGDRNILHTCPLEKDARRIIQSVMEARKQSDCVIVSIHSHQFAGDNKNQPAEFMRIFSRECIDAGASIIAGHGPHVLRGIEVYNKGVIFYGLGNYLFQNETVSHLPAEFYEKYMVDHSLGVASAMDARSKNGSIGLNIDKNAWTGMIASIQYDDGAMHVRLFPIELGYDLPRHKKGLPRLSQDISPLLQVKELSSSYATEIEITGGVGSITVRED